MFIAELSVLKLPIVCQVLVKVSITVSSPVTGSIVVPPAIIVVMTKIKMGITKQIPVIIYNSGIVNILLRSTDNILFNLFLK